MRTVYVDTGAFIALLWASDQDHSVMRKHYEVLRAERARLVTSDPVIAETTTRLGYDVGLSAALEFHDVVRDAVSVGRLEIRESNSDLRTEAFGVMARYDSLRLSYADCVGAAVATDVRADAIFGLDNDFRVMGFALEPTSSGPSR